jgi:hypothetical protein
LLSLPGLDSSHQLAAPADFDWNTESTAEHAATDAPALASFNNATPAAVAETVKVCREL